MSLPNGLSSDSGLLVYVEPANKVNILLRILKALFASADCFLAVCQMDPAGTQKLE